MRGLFLLSKLYVSLGISLKLFEINKFYGLGLMFVLKERSLVYGLLNFFLDI